MKNRCRVVFFIMILLLVLIGGVSYAASDDVNDVANDVGKSSNNFLKSLGVENATIEPEFNRTVFEYKVKLKDSNVNKMNILAETEDEKATVTGVGEVELKSGKNRFQVVARAENGNIQIYNLEVELTYVQSELRLTSLEVEGIGSNGISQVEMINPKFNKEVFDYTLNVDYDISSLNVITNSDENTFVSIEGQDMLQVGENKVVVKVIDYNDEDKSTTYIIKVTRADENAVDKSYMSFIITAVIILVIVVTIIIIFMIRKRKDDN